MPFIYPPSNSETEVETYNYIDTVNVSWTTTTTNTSEAYLTLWYYLAGEPWALGYNKSVALNGSKLVDLNITGGGYYGQFNFDFGSDKQYLSVFFNVDDNTTQSAVTWPKSSTTASASTSTTSSSTTATAASKSTVTVTATPSSSSSSSSTSGLSKGATAGIAVGVVAAVIALALGLFLFWRRRKTATTPRSEIRYELTGAAPPIQEKYSETPPEKPRAEMPEDRALHELSAEG